LVQDCDDYLSAVRNGPPASGGAKIGNFAEEQKLSRAVWNGRPSERHAEPLGLYHPVFSEFHDAMEDTEPFCADAATYDAVRNIMNAFSDIREDSNERASAIEEFLKTLLDRAFTSTTAKKVKSDGVMTQPCGQFTAYLMILEMKNEIGEGGSDPYNQGSLAYQKYWTSRKLK